MSYDPNAPRYNWLVTCRDGTRLTYKDFQFAEDVRASHTVNYAQYDPTRMADTIVRKDIPEMLSAEELQTYRPGHNCTCSAITSNGCRCNANWTMIEIYTLRNMVCDLEKENDSLKAAVAKNHEVIGKLRDTNTALNSECSNANAENEALKKEIKKAAQDLAAAGTAFSDYVSDVLANQDRLQSEYEKFISDMSAHITTTDYAINA